MSGSTYVDKAMIGKAKKADLYDFLVRTHMDLFRRVGVSICMRDKKSLYIKRGYFGYTDFATGETGNGIDYLMKYLGYNFQDAVIALAGYCSGSTASSDRAVVTSNGVIPSQSIQLPKPAELPYSRLYGFLLARAIPKSIIDKLVKDKLLYQEADHANIVFVNKERDYCELRGTYTKAKAFHGCLKARADRFWYVIPGKNKPTVAYVTEAAIDAISLMILSMDKEDYKEAVYISIGGVANYSTIDRIRKQIRTVIAVDNDAAGDMCRARYPELETIRPTKKDWNEDLMEKKKGGGI